MQIATIEFARNVLGKFDDCIDSPENSGKISWGDANSTEFNSETTHPVIHIMEEQKEIVNKGGTMRLGLYPCKLSEGTISREAYGESLIYERHRHRYEFNNAYRKDFTKNGLVFAGLSPDENLVEIIELPSNRWFVGVQFHPEFKSRPNKPHKLFFSFIKACK
jgi:CTP synthase